MSAPYSSSGGGGGVGGGGGEDGGGVGVAMIDLTLLDSDSSDSDSDSDHHHRPSQGVGGEIQGSPSSSTDDQRGGGGRLGPQHGGEDVGFRFEGEAEEDRRVAGWTVRNGNTSSPRRSRRSGGSHPPDDEDASAVARASAPTMDGGDCLMTTTESNESGVRHLSPSENRLGGCDEEDDEGEDDEDGDFPTRFRNTADAAENDGGSGDFPKRVRVRVMEAVLDDELLGPESNDASASSVVGREGHDEGKDVVRREKSQRRREAHRRRRRRRRERMARARAAASSPEESKTGDDASRGDRRGGNNGVSEAPLDDAPSDVEWGNCVDGDRRHLDLEGRRAGAGQRVDDDHLSMPVPSVPTTCLDPPRWLGGEMGNVPGKGKKRRRPMGGIVPPTPPTPEMATPPPPPPPPLPPRRRHRRFDEPCRFFARGRCMRGKKCWYRHDGDDEGNNDDASSSPGRKDRRDADLPPGDGNMSSSRPQMESAEVESSAAGESSARTGIRGSDNDPSTRPADRRNASGGSTGIITDANVPIAAEEEGDVDVNGEVANVVDDGASSNRDSSSTRPCVAGGMESQCQETGEGEGDDDGGGVAPAAAGRHAKNCPHLSTSVMRRREDSSSSSAGTSPAAARRHVGDGGAEGIVMSSGSVAEGQPTNDDRPHPPSTAIGDTSPAAAPRHGNDAEGASVPSSSGFVEERRSTGRQDPPLSPSTTTTMEDHPGKVGDARPPPSSSNPTYCKKGGVRRRWHFAVDDPTHDEVERVRRTLSDGVGEGDGEVRYAVFGLVDGVDSSTRMRGYVSFRRPRRPGAVRRFFSVVAGGGRDADELRRAHRFEFEPGVGDERLNLDRIRCGDHRTEEEECESTHGVHGPNNGSVSGCARVEEFGERAAPGRRTDLERKRVVGGVKSDGAPTAAAVAASSSEVTYDTNDAVDDSTRGGAAQAGGDVEPSAESTHGTPPECIDLTGCDGVPVENDGADDDWNATEINLMLDVVETNLPKGNEMWEAVAVDYNRSATADGARRRSASQIRSMFESLVNSDGKAGEKRTNDGETSDRSETVVSVIDIDESSDESGINGGESPEPSINTDGRNQSAVDPGVPGDDSAVDVIFVKVVATPAQVRLARRQAAANVRRVNLDSPQLHRAPAPRPKLKFKPRPHAKKRRSRSVSTDILVGSDGEEREGIRHKKRSRSLSTDASVSSVATDGVDVQQHQGKKHKTSHQDASGDTSVASEGSHVQSNDSMEGAVSRDIPVLDKNVCSVLGKPVCDSSNACEGEAQASTLNGKVDMKVSVAVDASSVPMEGEASSGAGGDSSHRAVPISSSAIAGGDISNVVEGQRPSHAISELVVRFVKSDLFTKDGRQNPLGMKISRVRWGKTYFHVVESVERGSPAEIEGITANLAICSINGHIAEHMNLMDARTWETALSNLANGEGGSEGSLLEIRFRSLGASQMHTYSKVNESANCLSQAGDKNIPSHASTTRTRKNDLGHSSASMEYGTTNNGGFSQTGTIDLSSPSELNIDQKTEASTSTPSNVTNESEPKAARAAGDTNAKKTSEPKKTRKPKRKKKPVNERAWTHYNFNKKNRQYSSTEAYRFSSGQDRHFHCPVEDALREQERLLSESAARVRGRMEAERLMALSSTSSRIRYFTLPVSNMRDLPDSHWTWSDPYSRLGLPRSSSALLVKRHYRKLALMYHPDKSRRPDALDRFHAIKEAYELLTKHSAVPSQAYHS